MTIFNGKRSHLKREKNETCMFSHVSEQIQWKVGSDLYPSIHLNWILARFRGYCLMAHRWRDCSSVYRGFTTVW